MTATYECPGCGAEMELGEGETEAECPECDAVLELDVDAEVVGDRWVDRSRLMRRIEPGSALDHEIRRQRAVDDEVDRRREVARGW
jgi:hypothetical protein